MSTAMLDEILSIPDRIAAQLACDEELYRALGERLRSRPPAFLATIARGSSDSVASYLAQVAGRTMGMITASVPPSLVTHPGHRLRCDGCCAIAISQSGQSPDLVRPIEHMRESGALSIAIVNDPDSPLARAAEWVLPAHAGPELSVAATKSFIACATAAIRLVAHSAQDEPLLEALRSLPGRLAGAIAGNRDIAVEMLTGTRSAYVIGRGAGLAVAQETALKLKETCLLQAEAFSSAEIKHGPFALIEKGFPVLAIATPGPFQDGVLERVREMRALGALVLVAAPAGDDEDTVLALPPPLHPELDPLVALAAVYGLAARLAEARGLDPDHPRNLHKVTLTY